MENQYFGGGVESSGDVILLQLWFDTVCFDDVILDDLWEKCLFFESEPAPSMLLVGDPENHEHVEGPNVDELLKEVIHSLSTKCDCEADQAETYEFEVRDSLAWLLSTGFDR